MANRIDLGLVIPWDYSKRQQPAVVQLLLNGVDVNTAQIAQGYAEATIGWLNQQRMTGKAAVEARLYGHPATGGSAYPRGQANLLFALLYNPGLETAWFVVTGVYGVLLILAGALVASGTMVRERESGTLEQLLMTPASALEIIAAKMCPLFFLVMASFCIMLFTGIWRSTFHFAERPACGCRRRVVRHLRHWYRNADRHLRSHCGTNAAAHVSCSRRSRCFPGLNAD